jgi:Tol biopolymer transport system component
VALVDPTGAVLAQAAGQSVMSATVDGVRGTTMLHVFPKPEADLVYQATRGNRTTLLIARPGEDREPVMIFADGRHALDPAVSPDGQWIAFTSLGEMNNADIWVARRDGSGLRRLTTHAAVDEQPAWSPDGTRLAFRSERDGLGDIWVMNADGTGLVNLTRNTQRFGIMSSFRPSWSPDGTRLVFAEGPEAASPFRSWIASVRPDGTDLRVLTNVAGYSDAAPAWSPDGRVIAIERRALAGGATQLQFIGADGSEVLLPYELGPGTAPSWSRDGRFLAFTDQGEVWVTQLGESVRRRVTEGLAAGGGVAPDWFPR